MELKPQSDGKYLANLTNQEIRGHNTILGKFDAIMQYKVCDTCEHQPGQ